VLRYMVPVVPLLVCGGAAACADLATLGAQALQRAFRGRARGEPEPAAP
jgi:hypothetical protein